MNKEKEDCNEERRKLKMILDQKRINCYLEKQKIWGEYAQGIKPGGFGPGGYFDDGEVKELNDEMTALWQKMDSIDLIPCREVRKMLDDSSPPDDSLDGLVDKSHRMMPYKQLLNFIGRLSLGQMMGMLPYLLRGPVSMIGMISGARGLYKEYGKIIQSAIRPVAQEFDSFTAYGHYLDNHIVECIDELGHYRTIIKENLEFIDVAVQEYNNIPPQNTKEKEEAEDILRKLIIEHLFSLIIIKDLIKEEIKVYKRIIDEIFDEVLKEQEQSL